MRLLLASVACAALFAGAAHASIVVDGSLDGDYGSPTASVAYNPAAPTSNFAAPTNENSNVAYDIYLQNEGGVLYGFLQAAGSTGGLDFANLYFDLDPANGNGSDLGFEVTNDRAFIPGIPGYSGALGLDFALGTNSLEFALPDTLFTAPIAGLTYYPAQAFPGPGGQVTLRLSQSFGFSVAGGASYGPDRLGSFNVAGAPEPAAWAMMLLGFLGAGATLRSARRRARLA